jgi:glycosyltransferase involved in cell wall biosynthesis
MKILQFITELTPAGAERIVCELSRSLAEQRNNVLVLSLMPLPENESILDELRSSQIQVQSLNVTKITPLRICGIRKVIREFKPEIVHAHLIHPNIISRVAKIANPLKFRLVNTVHIAERRRGKWWHFILDRITFSLCDCQTAVSKAVRDFHSAKIAKTPDQMPVIYNGVTEPKTLSEQEIKKLRSGWGIAGCSKVIGSVGRLDWQKGYDLLLNQLPEISAAIPDGENWGVVILGEGGQRAELENIAKSLNLKNIDIILPGFRKDAADSIGAFDLFVMPSRYEGFGLTLVEAMGHGIPILASSADSLPELMEYYNNGKCIDFSETSELCNEITRYIDKDFIHVPDQLFSIDQMVKQYLKVYRKR